MEEVEFGVGLKHWEGFLSYNEKFWAEENT